MRILRKLFGSVVVIIVIVALGASKDYRKRATTALERMHMSSSVLRDFGPSAKPDTVDEILIGQGVAVIDESLAHLETMYPPLWDIKAWQVHLAMIMQSRQCRALLDRIEEKQAMTTTEIAHLSVLCDPIPDDGMPVPVGDAANKVEQ